MPAAKHGESTGHCTRHRPHDHGQTGRLRRTAILGVIILTHRASANLLGAM
jgi:hypothetical protein